MIHSLMCSTSFMMRDRGRAIHRYLFLKKLKIVHFWRPVALYRDNFSLEIKINWKRLMCRSIHEVSLNPTSYGNNPTNTYVSTCRFIDLLHYYYHRLIYYKLHAFPFIIPDLSLVCFFTRFSFIPLSFRYFYYLFLLTFSCIRNYFFYFI